jgi:hypothetical protein
MQLVLRVIHSHALVPETRVHRAAQGTSTSFPFDAEFSSSSCA